MIATLQDIAKQAGVSPMTASRVLRGLGRVNPKTRQRVVTVARRLGYCRESVSQGLCSVRAGNDLHLRVLLGIQVSPKFGASDQPLHCQMDSQIIDPLSEQLELTGGKLVVIKLENLDQIVAEVQKHRPHGLVLRQPIPTDWLETLRPMLPAVYAVSYDHQSKVDSIYTNEHRSAALLYKKLTELGHQAIGWFGIVDRHATAHEWSDMYDSTCLVDRLCSSIHTVRYAAWANLAYCQIHNNRQPLILIERDWRHQKLVEVVSDVIGQFLQLRPQPTALVTPANDIALCVIEVLKQRGLRVPEDMSVVSYGGIKGQSVKKQLPRIASVCLPMDAIGKVIPELIRRRLAGFDALPMSLQLETEFLEGQSLGPVCH